MTKIKKLLLSLIAVFPFLGGATSTCNSLHERTSWKYTSISPDSATASQVASQYGYFKEYSPPGSHETDSNGDHCMTFTFHFTKMTYAKFIFYMTANERFNPKAIGTRSVKEIASINYRRYYGNTEATLKANITAALNKTPTLYTNLKVRSYDKAMALGFYVDNHYSDAIKGEFFYFTFKYPFCSGRKYTLSPGISTTYSLRHYAGWSVDEDNHINTLIGGPNYQQTKRGIGSAKITDPSDNTKWKEGNNNFGEYSDGPMRIPMSMEVKDANGSYMALPCEDPALYIFDGLEDFDFKRRDVDLLGNSGYRIPLKINFDGHYTSFSTKEKFYMSLDGRRVFDSETKPSNRAGRLVEMDGLPLPKSSSADKVFSFKMELGKVGYYKLVNWIGSFKYSKSNNIFGGHEDANYYVEEN